MNESLVKNAADEQQVKDAGKKLLSARERELADLRKALELKEVRDFVWRILEKTKVFGSIWEQSARIHYNAGQQDLGHFIMAEINDANQQSLFQMMIENKKEKN
jgi:hypothetical protein